MKKLMLAVSLPILGLGCLFMNTNTVQAASTAPMGVSIQGTDITGMSVEEVSQVISDYVAQYTGAQVTLMADDRTSTATAGQLGVYSKDLLLAQEAVSYGKTGHLIARYEANADLEAGKTKDFAISLAANPDTIKTYFDEHSDSLDIAAENNSLTRVNGEFQYVKGQTGVSVLTNESAAAVMAAVSEGLNSDWTGDGLSVALSTYVVEPKGDEEMLSQVTDLLGSYSTDFSTSSSARAANVANATSKLNGQVLYPGDELSVHETISPMTEENGYQMAGAYENGATVQAIGGGICQVSTTLYNAVMRAELEIVTRSSHSMIVSYVEPSMDAAIAGESKDFQFRNSLDYPVYIEGYTVDRKVYFNIYGKETRDPSRQVTFESEILSEEPAGITFSADGSLPVGTIQKVSGGHDGYVARLWKIVNENGAEVERRVYNNSKYKVSNASYAVGLAGASGDAAAAINAAIATQDEATIRAAVAAATGSSAQTTTNTTDNSAEQQAILAAYGVSGI